MIKSLLLLAALLFSTGAMAQAPSVSDADILAAATECAVYQVSVESPRWAPGWEHCETVYREQRKRQQADFERRRALPPASSLSKALAGRLSAKP